MGGIEPANAVCRLDRDGTLSIIVGTVDMSGTNTAFAQIAAEAFGLPARTIRVVNGDTEAAPYAGASGGSKITYTVGSAVERAARDARRQLLAIAADRLEAAVEDLEIVDRAIRVRGVPGRAVPIAELAKACMQFGAKYEPVYGRGWSATVARSPAFAAHLSEVEVDTETGAVRVLASSWSRTSAAPSIPRRSRARSRAGWCRGSAGRSSSRCPTTRTDSCSPPRSWTTRCRRATRSPLVESVLLEVASEHGPFGAKGVGEPPVVGVPAAIANAVAAATGHRFTSLPITAQDVVEALDGGAGRDAG